MSESQTTGRYLALLHENAPEAGAAALRDAAGRTGSSVVFEQLGVALVSAPPERREALGAAASAHEGVVAFEPERRVRAIADAGAAVEELALGAPRVTWGLRETGVAGSRFSGRGVRVAVLDTGLDRRHPDFSGRKLEAKSFVTGESADDGHGHGTHCIGTACGPAEPEREPRYGIAYGAEIWAGKVLGDDGSGVDGGILAGIDWAVANSCRIVSMSLGAPVAEGQPYSRVFEAAARRARRRGTLIVAAAGNDSDREAGIVNPVGHPANCPSIAAVAAVDRRLAVAPFSNAGLATGGGQIDLAGPGVDVRSSWPLPGRYRTLSGTSMATPHVAGIAALLAEAEPLDSADRLLARLAETARQLPIPPADVGAGLVHTP